jgi:hypothetical protein
MTDQVNHEERMVPLDKLLAERKKRQDAEHLVKELEATELHKRNLAFRVALVALGADPNEIIAEMNR